MSHLWSDQQSIDELKHKLVCTNLELESARSVARQEMAKYQDMVKHLLNLLKLSWRERDEAQRERDEARNHMTLLENMNIWSPPETPPPTPPPINNVINDQLLPALPESIKVREQQSANATAELDDIYAAAAPTNVVRSSSFNALRQQPKSKLTITSTAVGLLTQPDPMIMTDTLVGRKPLPEKGRLLQAVVEAGPLLHTLTLPPLPQWKNPPPLPYANNGYGSSHSHSHSQIPSASTVSFQMPPPAVECQFRNIADSPFQGLSYM